MTDARAALSAALSDRYAIERELGSGGMATVYLAEDRKHHRHVAVKVLRPELAAILGGERFLREIAIAAKLNHPHILALHDSGEADGFLYYVMPHVEGESLRTKLTREKQLAIDEAVTLTSQVASALDYAHGQGVIHRDIKPENILLHRGEAVVADFGIALAVTAAGGERLTETGLSLGTPEYMSPEQATGSTTLDARSDVYALGAVLYEMVTGEPPQRGATVQAVMAKLLSERPTRPRVVRDSVPEAVDRAIMKALAKVPADRFASAGELAAALTVEVETLEADVKSIVVLPFENLSPDPDNAFFADGLTEEVTSDLSGLRALRVIARTSAMTFKESGKRAAEIASALNVRYVLEGSVRRAGNSLRITAQLIDAATDTHVWTGKYPGTLEDVFDIQEKVSRSIADALKVALGPGEERRLSERPIDNVQAYECYLRASSEMWLLTEDAHERALKLIDRGLEIVGDNDLLYALKGLYYHNQIDQMIKPPETYPDLLAKMQACADRALAINPDSAAAHTIQGYIGVYSGDPVRGRRHISRALQLDPNHALAHVLSGYFRAGGGWDLDGARSLLERVARLDPLTPVNKGALGWLHWYSGDFKAALQGWADWQRECEQVKSPYRILLAYLHAADGNVEEAVRIVDRARRDSPRDILTALGTLLKHAWLGEGEQARLALTEREERAIWWDDIWSLLLAGGYAMIGDSDRALHWLDHVIDWFWICNPKYLGSHDPFLARLRSDERFETLLAKAQRISDAVPAAVNIAEAE